MPENEVSPSQVVLKLMELSRQLQKLSEELDGVERDAVEAKEVYTVEYARKFLENTGAVEVRKQQTLLDTSDVRLQADIAEQMVRAHKRKIDTLRTRIDIGRSTAALVRAEAELLKMPR